MLVCSNPKPCGSTTWQRCSHNWRKVRLACVGGAPIWQEILPILVFVLRFTACSKFCSSPLAFCAGRSLVDVCSDPVSPNRCLTPINTCLLGLLQCANRCPYAPTAALPLPLQYPYTKWISAHIVSAIAVFIPLLSKRPPAALELMKKKAQPCGRHAVNSNSSVVLTHFVQIWKIRDSSS
jgi:hypothetical protein